MTRQIRDPQADKLTEYLRKTEKVKTYIETQVNGFKRTDKLVKPIVNAMEVKLVESNKQKNAANKSQNALVKHLDTLKKTKKVMDDVFGYVEDTHKYISPILRKSTKITNFVNNKLSTGAGKLAENMVNFTGNVANKDLKRYAGAAKQLSEVGIKKLVLGNVGPKAIKKLNKNPIAKSMYSGFGKLKDFVKDIDKHSLHDMAQKSSGIINKGMKKIGNTKIAGMMNKAADLKIFGAMKKVGNNPLLKRFTQAFSPVGTAMNVHTMMTDKSDFKRGLAALDVAGDFTPLAPITSAISLAGGLVYDGLNSKFMQRFGGDKVAKALDSTVGAVVHPIKSAKKVLRFMKKGVAGIKKHGLHNSLKAGMNLVKKKTPEPIKKALKGYANMYLHPIQTAKKAGAFLANKSKDMFKKPKLKDYNDIYYRNLAFSKAKNPAINHNSEAVQTRHQIDNSNKNNFTINITGINKSTQEIMNEIVPEIKLRMKNISVA